MVFTYLHTIILKALSLKKNNFRIIGSAHCQKEIMKKKQGCELILFSKLFMVSYDKEAPFCGVIKFNNILNIFKPNTSRWYKYNN